jgi:hypothetical protein
MPHDRYSHDRGDIGEENHRPEQGRSPYVPRKQDCEEKRKNDRGRNSQAGIDECCSERVQKLNRGEDVQSFLYDEDGRIRTVPPEKTQYDSRYDGYEHKGQEAREIRREKCQSGKRVCISFLDASYLRRAPHSSASLLILFDDLFPQARHLGDRLVEVWFFVNKVLAVC